MMTMIFCNAQWNFFFESAVRLSLSSRIDLCTISGLERHPQVFIVFMHVQLNAVLSRISHLNEPVSHVPFEGQLLRYPLIRLMIFRLLSSVWRYCILACLYCTILFSMRTNQATKQEILSSGTLSHRKEAKKRTKLRIGNVIVRPKSSI